MVRLLRIPTRRDTLTVVGGSARLGASNARKFSPKKSRNSFWRKISSLSSSQS
jgi:hypothetical protein